MTSDLQSGLPPCPHLDSHGGYCVCVECAGANGEPPTCPACRADFEAWRKARNSGSETREAHAYSRGFTDGRDSVARDKVAKEPPAAPTARELPRCTHLELQVVIEDLARMALDVASDAMQQFSFERDRSEGDEAATYDKAAHDAERLFNHAWRLVNG